MESSQTTQTNVVMASATRSDDTLSNDQAPFAPLHWGRYEQIKDSR
jgi:hypothetical protein